MNNPYLSSARRLKPALMLPPFPWERKRAPQLPMMAVPLKSSPLFVRQVGMWDARSDYAAKYSWAVPTATAIRAIAKYGPIVEVGAGSGYWAWMLQQAGADVLACDIKPRPGYWRPERHWTRVRIIEGPEAAKKHRRRTLMFCWPGMKAAWPSQALEAFQGQHVVYVGERGGGCTADRAFHELLYERFEVVEHIVIPQWFGMHDDVGIYRRKQRG